MRKILSLFLILILVLCSCAPVTDDNQSSYVSDVTSNSIPTDTSDNSDEDSNTSDESSQNSDESSTEVFDVNLDLDTDIGGFNHTIIFETVLGAEHLYYAHFGENYYVTVFKDDEFGTACIKDGEIIAFYPDVTNVYEKDGTLYGILSEGEAYIDIERYYCRLNKDGTFEKLFWCWNVFYVNDKIYFYEYTSEKNESGEPITNICSANIDGSCKQVVSADVPWAMRSDRIICYNDYLVYAANYDDIYVMSSDNILNKVVDGSDAICEIEFINNGFLYYAKMVSGKSTGIYEPINGFSLWRVGLDGKNREQLFAEDLQISTYNFNAVAFAGKLLLFLPDGVRVYTDSMANYTTYEYEKFSYEEIMQISVYNGQLCVVGNKKGLRNHQTVVYDSKGNVTFEYGF